MRTLKLLALAASAAALPATGAQALADPAPGPEAGHWRDAGPPVRTEMHREMHRGERPMRGHVRRFAHIPRIHRGGFVPQMWWGPQFVVRDWHGFGFPQPFHGGRWIRYYDDALLIDRYGRVHDGRYGWDWERGGDRWGEGPDGVPVYVGDGDYEPEAWDYEWAERWERGERPEGYGYGHDGPPPHPGYGAYGAYGCGCGPVVVTETTTTTQPVVELRTWYEYVYEDVPARRTKAAPPRRYKAKTVRRPAPARPGERG